MMALNRIGRLRRSHVTWSLFDGLKTVTQVEISHSDMNPVLHESRANCLFVSKKQLYN